MRLPISGVYRIVHVTSGKEYIGSSGDIANRWNEHRRRLTRGTHHARHLQHSWVKYGAEAFIFEIIECAPPEDILAIEQRLLNERKPIYNWSPTAGSRRGAITPQETREKQRMRKLGVPLTLEHRATLSMVRKGVLKPKSVAAMVASTTGVPKSPEHRAKLSLASSTFRLRHPERHAELVAKRNFTLQQKALARRTSQSRLLPALTQLQFDW